MNNYRVDRGHDEIWKIKKGISVDCFSRKKLKKTYKGYSIVGETCRKNRKKKIATLKVGNTCELVISRKNSYGSLFYSKRKFLKVDSNSFVAIVKFRVFPIILLALLMGLAVLGHYVANNIEVLELIPNFYSNITEAEGYEFSGKVTCDDEPLKNATVQLLRGNEIIGETVTDSEGNFIFKNIQNGYYSVVVRYGDRTVTRMIRVYNKNANLNINLFSAKQNSTLTIDDDTNFAADGMQQNAEKQTDDNFTINLRISRITKNTESLKSIVSPYSGDLSLVFFKTKLTKQYSDRIETIEYADELIEIAIPFDVNATYYYVFNIHNGIVSEYEEIKDRSDAKENSFYVDKGTIIIYTRNCDTFAIGYVFDDSIKQGRASVVFNSTVEVDLANKTASLSFKQLEATSSDSIAELIVLQNGVEYIIGTSDVLPPGAELTSIKLNRTANAMSPGSFSGILRIRYELDEDLGSSTNVDIPITLTAK